jgi:hypothetical protein
LHYFDVVFHLKEHIKYDMIVFHLKKGRLPFSKNMDVFDFLLCFNVITWWWWWWCGCVFLFCFTDNNTTPTKGWVVAIYSVPD